MLPSSQAAAVATLPDVASTPLPMQIGMLVASTADAGGGVMEALRSLTRALQRRPMTMVNVYSMSDPKPGREASWGGASMHSHTVCGPHSFAYSPALNRSLAKGPIELLHLHGLWMYPSVATRQWGIRSGKPCLVSPHGMLDGWALANSRWKKRLVGRLYEHDNLRRAACLHALCEAELHSIRDCGLLNPVCIIPNGVDPAPNLLPPRPLWREALPPAARVLLYLGRLHPKKNLQELVQAWHTAGSHPTGHSWHLVIAGPGSADYVDLLRRRIVELNLSKRIHLIEPQYGAAKETALGCSDAFILPSLSEGLPMAALEAWAWGLPALLTPHCNLPEGFSSGAALRIDTGSESIAAGLGRLFALSEEQRRKTGQRGQELVARRFTWDRVAAEFDAVYRWLLGTGKRPDCIDAA